MSSSSKLQVVKEIHRYARKNFRRRKYTMYSIAETLQVDLIEMQPFKRENQGFRYILLAIDIFSKNAYAEPLKDKSGLEVSQAMERVIKKVNFQYPDHHIRNCQSDLGKEFYNQHMKQVFDKYNINHYSTFSYMKAAIVERLIRTIKNRLYVQFSMQGNYKWHHLLPQIIETYNDTR